MVQRRPVIGIIGGSGLEQGLELGETETEEVHIETPFGNTSGLIALGAYADVPIAFLPRHGRFHTILPHNVPSRANIWALKSLGVQTIMAFCAVGSLCNQLHPGDLVLPSQLVDKTWGRTSSFFHEDGVAAHISVADPICFETRQCLLGATPDDLLVRLGSTLCCIQGPRFSTRAESDANRQLNSDLVGMTVCPEAFLAREAELPYVVVALVTDYDCWHTEHGAVDARVVMDVMARNVESAKRLLATTLPELAKQAMADCSCRHALADAIMTPAKAITTATFHRLELLIGKYFPPAPQP